MGSIKSLAKDTAIYGVSSIVGRFLNWLLVPLYTNMFSKPEYGKVTFIYAVTALLMVALTYGMETGFFRFANHDRWKKPMQVYSTALISLAVSSTAFALLVVLFASPLAALADCPGHPSYIWMMGVCVAIDAFTALPFSYLRYARMPMRFAAVKIANIGINIGLNLFFILLCPWLMTHAPGSVDWFYDPSFSIGYIFLSNLIASVATLLLLAPQLRGFAWSFNGRLWHEMIVYSLPLLALGIAGIMNQNLDKIIFPFVYKGADAEALLGVYGACFKIAIVMVMFTQAFRFAFEPFIFSQNKEQGSKSTKSYSDATKYFIIFTLFIFLGVMYYLDILKYFIGSAYRSGLEVVPVIMLAEIFFGVHFNLSLWYKLCDCTIWGLWFSLIGLAITVTGNILFIPAYGYHACAWTAFFCYLSMMVANYLVGQRRYPIAYPLRRIALYVAIAAVLYVVGMYVAVTPWVALNFVIRALLLGVYVIAVMHIERITPRDLAAPLLHRLHPARRQPAHTAADANDK